MSRIGKAPISLPSNVDVAISKGNLVTVKGPKGSLSYQVDMDIKVEVEDGTLSVTRDTDLYMVPIEPFSTILLEGYQMVL